MGWFAPDDFQPIEDNFEWAILKFSISRKECEAQTELMLDHEFKRGYTDWQRVWRNWMRKAEEIQTLRRERKAWKPEVVTDEMRKEDIKKFDDQIARFKKPSKSGVR